MHISLRAGEKIYINCAVLRVDRKVSLELLNDATFLLEAHGMKVEDASTPLRQLYFIIEIMLMNPTDSFATREMFKKSIQMTNDVSESALLVAGLRSVKTLVEANRIFDALKAVRALFPIEAEMLPSWRTRIRRVRLTQPNI
ncbi:MAG: flagellum biosynthesis repressor protein FlbT [Beijerinckiaceae bacterium]|nr:MAG: flagellum biosynthesis repressor protein FlbT [Beijerinckiaceae bacterium]